MLNCYWYLTDTHLGFLEITSQSLLPSTMTKLTIKHLFSRSCNWNPACYLKYRSPRKKCQYWIYTHGCHKCKFILKLYHSYWLILLCFLPSVSHTGVWWNITQITNSSLLGLTSSLNCAIKKQKKTFAVVSCKLLDVRLLANIPLRILKIVILYFWAAQDTIHRKETTNLVMWGSLGR